MKVQVHYLGYQSTRPRPYLYRLLAENGKIDEIEERDYFRAFDSNNNDVVIEMDDRLWMDGSGHETVKCNGCGYEYYLYDRAYPSKTVTCPICDTKFTLPNNVVLEDVYNNEL